MTKYLLNYAPMPTTISAACWAVIGQFVIEAASDVEPTSCHDAQTLVGSVAQIVAWRHLGGVPLVREEMFTWETVDGFIRTEAKLRMTPYGRRLYRTHLRRVVDMVCGPRTASLNNAEVGEMPPVRAYTPEQEQAFRVMVSNQRTEHRRLNGEVLLALGFGAGLNSAEIAGFRATTSTRPTRASRCMSPASAPVSCLCSRSGSPC